MVSTSMGYVRENPNNKQPPASREDVRETPHIKKPARDVYEKLPSLYSHYRMCKKNHQHKEASMEM